MKSSREFKITLIAVLGVAVLCLSVAYAALSASLNVTGSGTVNAGTWNVGFVTNASLAASGKTGSATCPSVKVDAASVSLANIVLVKPGDSCTYTLTIKNNGTLAATLSSITPATPAATVTSTDTTTANNFKNYIKYTVSYDGHNVTNNLDGITDKALAKSATKTVVCKVEFLNTATSVPGTALTIGNITTTFNYVAS